MTEDHQRALRSARDETTSELHEARAEWSARFRKFGPRDKSARLNLWAIEAVLIERGELSRPDGYGPGAPGYRE
ncbi:hypothetical protein GTE7_gp081 [Gordonia phage GTE7]|uniref:Uncharacterized protein n=1 Tax=Gordonia phage GTE7 TaxID=1100814 RepID=G8FS74_9CAUD|nr:hypothetical protein GTE7_gp081 [Gordonia phage GTE7]AER26624.1 hypothetical protein [Gordonia phage GTE7]